MVTVGPQLRIFKTISSEKDCRIENKVDLGCITPDTDEAFLDFEADGGKDTLKKVILDKLKQIELKKQKIITEESRKPTKQCPRKLTQDEWDTDLSFEESMCKGRLKLTSTVAHSALQCSEIEKKPSSRISPILFKNIVHRKYPPRFEIGETKTEKRTEKEKLKKTSRAVKYWGPAKKGGRGAKKGALFLHISFLIFLAIPECLKSLYISFIPLPMKAP